MSARDEVLAKLEALGIAYDILEHEPVHTIEDCEGPARALQAVVPKNLVLTPRNRSAFYLLLTAPGAFFRTADVSKQLGCSRLSFAGEDDLARLLRVRPGAASPMGLIFDEGREISLLVDEALMGEKRLAFHPCENTATIAMAADDFFGAFLGGIGRVKRLVRL